MGEYGIGQGVPRTEDPRLLTGGGRYVDDIALPNQLVGVVVRSPHAHALIKSLDIAAAAAAPGVKLVLTGADYAAEGLGPMPSMRPPMGPKGTPVWVPPRQPLAKDRVRFVGDGLAFVVAETRAQALDAAELVAADYEPLPAVVETARLMEPDAPRVWPERESNLCFVYDTGDEEATEAAFAKAAHVVERRFVVNRVMANALEPNGCVGDYDRRTDQATLYACVQGPFMIRTVLAEEIFHAPESRFRVAAGDVGGSFGTKGMLYPEHILTVWAARKLGRPVKWTSERSEALLNDYPGRDNVTDAALALDADGRFLGLRVRTIANIGAYMSMLGAGPPINNIGSLAGVYTTPAAHVRVTGAFSNTGPTGPYRGAGRPEAAYVIERLVDIAARTLGLDPVELRRRNTVANDAFPYKAPLVFTYDSGNFGSNLEIALDQADYAGLAARREAAKARGRLLGLGISNTVERAVILGGIEYAEVRIDAGGGARVLMGSSDQGQGHKTVFTQLLNERLGIDPDSVTVQEGDTALTPLGGGAGGSSVATRGTAALSVAVDKIVDKARRVAAHLLEAAEADLEFEDGVFTVAGTDRKVSFGEVAKALYGGAPLPAEIEPGLYESGSWRATVFNFPNGCHVCEVEVDPDTGAVEIVRYAVVDDCGTVLNPLLLKGQIVGGLAQGAGQALMEDMRYDAAGQVLTGSFMDYAMPRADDLCAVEVSSNPAPTKTNPLGVKGGGEAGTVGALPAVVNAVNDALAPLGVVHLEMPATPEKVWRAIREART